MFSYFQAVNYNKRLLRLFGEIRLHCRFCRVNCRFGVFRLALLNGNSDQAVRGFFLNKLIASQPAFRRLAKPGSDEPQKFRAFRSGLVAGERNLDYRSLRGRDFSVKSSRKQREQSDS